MRGLVAPLPHPLGVIILLAIAVLCGWDVSHCAFHLYFSLFCASPAPLAPLMALITQYYGHILSHWMECPQCLSNQLKDPLSPVPSMSLFPHRWFFPIIGHMGICTSTGVIRDFAGPYFVSVSP